MKKFVVILLTVMIVLSAATACGNTEHPYDSHGAPSTETSTVPISDNPLIAAELQEGFVMNGSKTDVIGMYAYIHIDKSTLRESTLDEYTEFCETTADSILYNWVSIICDDWTGIQFTASQYAIATYGKINYQGVITEDIGYIMQTDNGFEYQSLEEDIIVPETTEPSTQTTPPETRPSATTPVPTVPPETTPPATQVPQPAGPTTSESNALKKAKEYLRVMPFSHDGLIDQLEYEGFSTADATYGADNCGADWNAQALKEAKDYLDVKAFSYSGLIDQLEYEKYTKAQATYGADNCGANWNEQAAKAAADYLDIMSFSRERLIDQLEYEGFTHEQAVYGVDSVGL